MFKIKQKRRICQFPTWIVRAIKGKGLFLSLFTLHLRKADGRKKRGFLIVTNLFRRSGLLNVLTRIVYCSWLGLFLIL